MPLLKATFKFYAHDQGIPLQNFYTLYILPMHRFFENKFRVLSSVHFGVVSL